MIKLNERVAVSEPVEGLYVRHEYFLTEHLRERIENYRHVTDPRCVGYIPEEIVELSCIRHMVAGRLQMVGYESLGNLIAYSRTDAFGNTDQISVAFHVNGESPKPWLARPGPVTDKERLRQMQILQERAAKREPIDVPEPAPRKIHEDLWGDK